MELEILPANTFLQGINEIDPDRIMVGHGIGFSAKLKPAAKSPKAQIPLFEDLPDLAEEKEQLIQAEGWVVEVLPGPQFKVALPHLKLAEPCIIVKASEVETHASFRRSLRRHMAGN